MSKITLYTANPSRGTNVRWMLTECGADYDNVVLDYPDGRSLMLTTAKDKACTGEEFVEDPIAPDAPESELDGWLASHCGF